MPHGLVEAVLTHSGLSPAAVLARQFTATFVFSNSLLNPILYCWKIKEVRRAVKGTIRQVLNVDRVSTSSLRLSLKYLTVPSGLGLRKEM